MSLTIVERADELPRALAELERPPEGLGRWLGVDSEGDGFHRYRTQLCVIQLGVEDHAAIVDPLAFEDLSGLAPLLESETPVKVLHDVSFDAKMLASRGLSLGAVFDTSVAARFLGATSTGLAALLDERFEVGVNKKYQRDDWGKRPLDEPRLRYLADDVRYLPALAQLLYDEAAAAGILEEIEDEARYAISRALEPEVERPPWTRIKGAKDLGPGQRALLLALTEERESAAEEADVPPFRIAPNPALLEAVARQGATAQSLLKIRGLARLGATRLRNALRRAPDIEPPEEPAPERPTPAERKRRKDLEKALLAWREETAKAREVDVQVVLPGHCMRDIAGLPTVEGLETIAGLGDKRLRLYGEKLRAILTA